jgi:L-fuconolactonase
MVIDSHLHLWDTVRLSYPWLRQTTALPRRFRLEDLAVGPVPVESVVAVEADCDPAQARDEVTLLLSQDTPRIRLAGIVGGARLDSAHSPAEVAHYGRIGKVKGVRHLLQDEPTSRLAEPRFMAGVRQLASVNLVFDLCLRNHQISAASALVASVPEVTFVLDHLGKPAVRSRPEAVWLADLRRLAALPNVSCKLSGLTSEVVGSSAGSRARGLFRPYLQHALDVFGPSRCMFGSDWPVAGLTSTYEEWFDHVVHAAAPLSAGELSEVLSGTASRTYRLDRDTHAVGVR